jgi:CRISPR-associated exonuclease Cas4
MIPVSMIREYLYCPLKVYTKIHVENIKPYPAITNISHDAVIGFEELIKRNLWHLKGEMQVKEILGELLKDIPEFLDTVYNQYQDAEVVDNKHYNFQILKEDLKFNSWLLAIKAQKILKIGLTGAEAVNLLFPPSLLEFKIEDKENGLLGQIDKIEIVDGVYYPVKIKTNLPPLKGVWQSDAIQITAYAYLMEHEFNKEILVGFVNYMRVGSKKPVLINTSLREKFSEIFNEIVSIVYDDKFPEVVLNVNKCRSCDYCEICEYSEEFK